MASKSAYSDGEKGAEIEEQLDVLDKLVDRLRVMYEQYFLGIAKQAPGYLHIDAERKFRDLAQLQIRNTAQRYRFATIGQKFGAYNSYWRRTLRDIEAGRYVRDLARIKRHAEQYGDDIPPEILAAMPKRMRDMVHRDREAARSLAERRHDDGHHRMLDGDESGDTAVIRDPGAVRDSHQVHRLDDLDVDGDFDQLVAAITRDAEAAVDRVSAAPAAARVPAPGQRAEGKPRTVREPADTIPTPMGAMDAHLDAEAPAQIHAPVPRPPTAQPKPAPPVPRAPTAPVPRAPTAPPRPPPIPPARAATTPPDHPIPTTARAATAPPRAPTAPPRATTARPGLAPPPGMSDDDARSLYSKFIKAREVVGESNDGMTYDKLIRTLRQQGAKIMEQYKASGVEFGVVIKDNKVVLKAKPKP